MADYRTRADDWIKQHGLVRYQSANHSFVEVQFNICRMVIPVQTVRLENLNPGDFTSLYTNRRTHTVVFQVSSQ